MTNKFFSWLGWDLIDETKQIFYDCILLQDIGPFSVGEQFREIYVDWDSGTLKMYDEDGREYGFRASIQITPDTEQEKCLTL